MVTRGMNPDQEQGLVDKARNDPEAFRELYRCYFPRVYAYIAYRVGRTQDIEDLVAEVFFKALAGLAGFQWRGEGSFAAWLFRIAGNLVRDLRRRRGRRGEPLSLEELPELEASTGLPEDAVQRKERFAELFHLMGALSPRRQEVIALRFFGGLKNREIARALSLDERTVAAHLARGLEELHRKYVEEHSERGRSRP